MFNRSLLIALAGVCLLGLGYWIFSLPPMPSPSMEQQATHDIELNGFDCLITIDKNGRQAHITAAQVNAPLAGSTIECSKVTCLFVPQSTTKQAISADTALLNQSTGELACNGSVLVAWDGFELTTDRAAINLKQQLITFDAAVQVIGHNTVVRAARGTINIKTEAITLRNPVTTVEN